MTDSPDNRNGAVLRRLIAEGDSLEKPRLIDFCFVFHERPQSIAFAAVVTEREYEVCLSRYEERDMWQAIVRKHMVPEIGEISRIELELTRRAVAAGGAADGWGCSRLVGA